MARVKQSSKKRVRAALPALGAAGLTFSMVGGASAAAVPANDATQTTNYTPNHQITLGEEEIADVSLATFHVFDRETELQLRQGEKLAADLQGGCGITRGCGPGGCVGASPFELATATNALAHARPPTLTIEVASGSARQQSVIASTLASNVSIVSSSRCHMRSPERQAMTADVSVPSCAPTWRSPSGENTGSTTLAGRRRMLISLTPGFQRGLFWCSGV